MGGISIKSHHGVYNLEVKDSTFLPFPFRYTNQACSDSVKNKRAVQWLLDHGADPNPRTPIYCVLISIAARDASLAEEER